MYIYIYIYSCFFFSPRWLGQLKVQPALGCAKDVREMRKKKKGQDKKKKKNQCTDVIFNSFFFFVVSTDIKKTRSNGNVQLIKTAV